MATVVLVGTLDTKGHEYALRARPPARGRGRRRCSSTRACWASRRSSPTSPARRSRAPRAPTTPSSCAAADRGARGRRHGARRGGGARAPARRGARRRRRRGRRLGQLLDRRARDARPAGRRAEADRLDRRLGRHAPLRRRRRRHDDVLGRRHRRASTRSRRRSSRNAAGAIAGMATATVPERPRASGRWSARRCSASRRRASRTRASAWRSSATRCSSSTPPAPAGSPSRRSRPAATSSARSTSRPPSWPTSSSAASCRPGPTASRPSGAPASRRSSRSARSTWSTSARATPCPERFEDRNLYVHNPTITLMRTTPEEMAELGRRIAAQAQRRRGRRPCSSSRCAACRPSTSTASRSATPRPTRRCSPRCARASTPAKVEVHEVDADVNDPAFATAMADRLHELIQEARHDARRGARPAARAGRAGPPDHRRRRGHGLSAKCAEDGGADLIIIYNSGRYRMAGRGSLAGMMPYGDANAIVMDMAREVLPVARDTPVLAGVCGTDPFRLMPQLPRGRQARGLHRRAELPDRRADRRHVPRRPGGDRHGLRPGGRDDPRRPTSSTCSPRPYVFTEDEARAMADAGADVLVPHMGLTTGGTIGAQTGLTLDEAVERVQALRRRGARGQPGHPLPVPRRPDRRARRRRSTSSSARPASSASSAPRAWSGCRPRSR